MAVLSDTYLEELKKTNESQIRYEPVGIRTRYSWITTLDGYGHTNQFVSDESVSISVAYRGGVGGSNPPPRNSEVPPKSCQTQPHCENC